MPIELVNVGGTVARVRDRTVGIEGGTSTGDAPSYVTTRYFNEIEIDVSESATPLAVLARWPDRLFLQNGDRIVTAGNHEQGKFQVLALCNLTDGSNYLFSGSPSRRRKLKRMLAPLLPNGTAEHWLSA
ncbi:hypothetical protein EC912_102770 [Luteibacter rhizovicinus]|uniref:Uncharacterized protein n=1 Tax=Luteibacter rhizovicinus TaxID=242606 RepID=A0A4V2W4L9_9GAMM|nr:hypothetical protein [Luteibacter rhizovicinus]TCV96419.1 hypothetical protein EC912_102770 [Luteibacter rhizovicinus]